MRQLHGRACVLALITALAVSLTGLVPSAHARPARVGAVTGLAVTIGTAAAGYRVDATWNPASNANGYRVVLSTPAGTRLDSGDVSTTSWTGTTTLSAGMQVKLTVTPYAGTRRGKAASVTRTLPDLRPPTATYTVTWQGTEATVAETALSDDLTPVASIKRSIDWGDGAGWQDWPVGTTSIQHGYAPTQGRYVPLVRLEDLAGNVAVLTLHAVVIADADAPQGSYTVTPVSAWARYTPVNLTQTSLSDDFTPAGLVSRVVAWGDGVVASWPTGSVTRHVYRAGGTFTPVVTLTDEAGNTSTVTGAPVTVKVDSVAPRVTIIVPSAYRRVSSWITLRGKAGDAGVGVRHVRVKAVQKRGAYWYAYKPALRSWVRAGVTSAAALSKAGTATRTPAANRVWSLRLARLRKGTLLVRVVGVDRVGNTSAPVVRKQALTRA